MALTSCHGQPVNADRSGEWPTSVTTFGITEARIGVMLSFTPKQPVRHAGQLTAFAFIYENTRLDATASQLMKRPHCHGFHERIRGARPSLASLPARLGMLPTRHGNSAKPRRCDHDGTAAA